MTHDKLSVLGTLITPTTYKEVVAVVINAAKTERPLSVAALAVHGVMEAVRDRQLRYRLNHIDIVTPDGQPVRWALHLLYGMALPDRVYGPSLMLAVCQAAEEQSLCIYLYGSTESVIKRLQQNLNLRFPNLQIVGVEPSKFRRLTEAEQQQTADRIKASGAQMLFVGLGCPRQEIWAYEFQDLLSVPILAVGAAFDFLSGNKAQASPRLQKYGLEWGFRLLHEPRRLWRRYLLLNPYFVLLLTLQILKVKHFDVQGEPVAEACRYG